MEKSFENKLLIWQTFKTSLQNSIKDAHKVFLWGFMPVLSFFLIVFASAFLSKKMLSSYALGYIANITALPYLSVSQSLWTILFSIFLFTVLLMLFLTPLAFATFTQKRRLIENSNLSFFECFISKFFWKFVGFYALFYLTPFFINIINAWLWAVNHFRYYTSYDINPNYFRISSLIINIVWFFLVIRLALVFPLVIKEQKKCVVSSWHLTKSYFWRITALLVLYFIFVFIGLAVLGLLTKLLFFLPIVISIIVSVITYFAFGFISLIVLPNEILCAIFKQLASSAIISENETTTKIETNNASIFNKNNYANIFYIAVFILLCLIAFKFNGFLLKDKNPSNYYQLQEPNFNIPNPNLSNNEQNFNERY